MRTSNLNRRRIIIWNYVVSTECDNLNEFINKFNYDK